MEMPYLFEDWKVIGGLDADERTSDGSVVNGTGVEVADIYDEVAAIAVIGGTNDTVDVHLEESDDDSTYTDITDAAIVQVAGDGDNVMPTVAVKWTGARKKYVRAVLAMVNTKVADTAVVLLGRARRRPVTNSPVSVLV